MTKTAVLPCCTGRAKPLFQDRDMGLTWVELGGLEPPTPCLQSDVYARVLGPDLRNRVSLSDRYVPLETGGTLMTGSWPGCWGCPSGNISRA